LKYKDLDKKRSNAEFAAKGIMLSKILKTRDQNVKTLIL